jgi:hypothetical protein
MLSRSLKDLGNYPETKDANRNQSESGMITCHTHCLTPVTVVNDGRCGARAGIGPAERVARIER